MKHHSLLWLAFSPSLLQSGQVGRSLAYPYCCPCCCPCCRPCCPGVTRWLPCGLDAAGGADVSCALGYAFAGVAGVHVTSPGFTKLPPSCSELAHATTSPQPKSAPLITALAPLAVSSFTLTSSGRRWVKEWKVVSLSTPLFFLAASTRKTYALASSLSSCAITKNWDLSCYYVSPNACSVHALKSPQEVGAYSSCCHFSTPKMMGPKFVTWDGPKLSGSLMAESEGWMDLSPASTSIQKLVRS